MGLAAQGVAVGCLAALAAVLQGCGDASPAPSPSPSPRPANPTVRLANGVMMPVVSAGTWQYNDSLAAATVEAALSVGFTHIDTAFDYNNQAGVGQGLKASGKARSEVFITSKVPGCGLQGVKDCYNDTARIIREDIRLLGSTGFPAEYLDLILIHFPPCTGGDAILTCSANHTGCNPDKCKAIQDQWRAVTEAYEAKLVRAVGVSNYCSGCFRCLEGAAVKPMVNQVQLHIGMGADPQGFASFAREYGTVLQAWSPLGSGGGGDHEILAGNLTTGIGKAHQKTAAQVALKWIVSHEVALSTKSSSKKHLAENLALFDFELTAEEMQSLDAADFHKADNPSFMCRDAPAASYADIVV